MKDLLRNCMVLLAFLLICSPLSAQWQKSLGLNGGNINKVVGNDSMLFALVPDGSLYSRTASSEWQFVSDNSNLKDSELFYSDTCLMVYGTDNNFEKKWIRSFDFG